MDITKYRHIKLFGQYEQPNLPAVMRDIASMLETRGSVLKRKRRLAHI